MKTFAIETLGCKVNQYESEQIAAVLREHGLVESPPTEADVRVVNSCSVTTAAAGKSRQTVRRLVSLPLLNATSHGSVETTPPDRRARMIVTGCWATSDPDKAAAIAGVDAVLTHHDDVAERLSSLLKQWKEADKAAGPTDVHSPEHSSSSTRRPAPGMIIGGMKIAGANSVVTDADSSPSPVEVVNEKPANFGRVARLRELNSVGTTSLPLLGDRQAFHQRAFLKVQDGCDAHCTYCIIPSLRPKLWSKSIDDAVEEARRLVKAGHVELVLTGIFLGAYGQPTALRRRQPASDNPPIAALIEALCTRVPGLLRVRLSSLEPGDLTPTLVNALRAHEQVVPHFHLPLQSGSNAILHRMNRQYTRDDFLAMVDAVNSAFDRPALTTDIIVGFPGETDAEFEQTLDIVRRSKFIHVHAFSFSARPGTAAARWQRDFVRGPVVNERIDTLRRLADEFSLAYRRQFVGETVCLLVERRPDNTPVHALPHGRSERYFDVHFKSESAPRAGDLVSVRIDTVTPDETIGHALADGD